MSGSTGQSAGAVERTTSNASSKDESREQRGSQVEVGTNRGGSGSFGLSRREPGFPSISYSTNPFSFIRRITEEMDRMFESFGQGIVSPLSGSMLSRGLDETSGPMWPQIEVVERDNNIVVLADLPGIDKNDIDVEITDNGLMIHGERRSEFEENRGGRFRSERSYGSFSRLIPLPEGVDADHAQATFRNGVLEVVLPAPQLQHKGRRIEIQDSSAGGQAQARGSNQGIDQQNQKTTRGSGQGSKRA